MGANSRAKFLATSIKHTMNGDYVELQAVTSGSDENKEFFKWTPSGAITLGVLNESISAQFEVGKEYYVDFTVAT